MSSEDQFTSIQWDRDEVNRPSNEYTQFNSIEEETEQRSDNPPDTEADNATINNTLASNKAESEAHADHADNVKDSPSNSLLLSPENNTLSAGVEAISQNEPSAGPTVSAPNSDTPIESTSQAAQQILTTGLPPMDTSQFDEYSIKTSVSNPSRDLDAASKPFISYLVTTTTDHPSVLKLSNEKKPNEGEKYLTFSVRRRYGDFRYLYESLNNDFPTVMIPPLPSKSNFKYLTGDTFSSSFVNKRLHSLDRFIRFILQHRVLSQSSIFHLFISNSNDWATLTTSLKIKDINYDDNSGGFVNKVVNEDLITETVMNFLTPSKHKRETNRDILEINDKLKKLYENLLKLDKIFVKLNRKNHDLSTEYNLFSTQIIKLASVQQSGTNAENEPAKIVKSEESVIDNFKTFAESLNYFSKSWGELYKYMDESFLVSLKDCAKYIVNLTNLIELQHNKRIDLQVLQDYLNKTRAELSGMGGSVDGPSNRPPPNPVMSYQSGGIVNNTTQLIKDTLSTSATPHIGSNATDNKMHKLENRVLQLENEITMQTKLVNDLTNKIITDEYPNWDRFNKTELKSSMLGLCDEQINFYKGLIDKWADVETKLTQRLDGLK
ncbi:SNX4 [[Candida] subhashii]|uniref:SNX4 n=1 Tax=[Candida] subhashii TaxID=561895 RepID=A0A8J5QIS4_9ASCO|nr:SNX4 [[Candida] subhashii]KAG7662724.1 SNX4 [[Candida] subhashii]